VQHAANPAPVGERATALKAILDAVEVGATATAREHTRERAQHLNTAVRHFHEGDYSGAVVHARRSQFAMAGTAAPRHRHLSPREAAGARGEG